MLDIILFASGCIVLFVSALLTLRTRFVQFRMLPKLFRLFFCNEQSEGEGTICSRRALLTAMSTTIGISTIVAPAIAIRLGGPGAVVGFLLATVLGAATSYAEVTFAVHYRSKDKGVVLGGPMQYLKKAFSPWLAKWYAFFCGILMLAWSSAQANQVAALFNSETLMGSFIIPKAVSGMLLAVSVYFILIGGIRRIASLSARLVPAMFVVYVGASLWIIFTHLSLLPDLGLVVLKNCIAPKAFGSGVVVGGILSALRWGMMKAMQGNEAGVGTQTFPHSVAEVKKASDQGILAMASTYCAGFVLLISSTTALISGTWQDPHYALGIDMVVGTYQQAFAYYGALIVAVSALLFAFGTILGNCYNGSQCFLFLTKGKGMHIYYGCTGIMVMVGAMGSVLSVWSYVDIVLALVIVPHVLAILWLSFKDRDVLVTEPLSAPQPSLKLEF